LTAGRNFSGEGNQVILDSISFRWEIPTVKVIADQKRRVVLPKPTVAGDAFECVSTGKHILLRKLEPVAKDAPPVAKRALKKTSLRGVNLDEPAFAPLDDAGAA